MTAKVCILATIMLGGCTGSPPEQSKSNVDPGDDNIDVDADSDGDGLLDSQEVEFGSDPSIADTDGDGLDDNQEFELGTSPNSIDSDDDTYSDSDEVNEGHSPTDPDDRIYIGYWPYNPNKESIVDPGFAVPPATDGTLPHFAWLDQFGQEVDIYDFGGQGKYTILDVSGQWCYWCHELADWLEYVESDYDEIYADEGIIRDSIADGSLQWVTAIDGNALGGPAAESTLVVWTSQHPIENIAVLLDANAELATWLSGGGPWFWPSYLVFDENMKIVLYPTFSNGGQQIFPALSLMLEP